jgi:hypothetical protein
VAARPLPRRVGGGCACMGTFYYMNQKHVVPESAVVFVRDRKRHAIASLNTGSLCCSEWMDTSKSYYGIVRLLFAFRLFVPGVGACVGVSG